MVMTDLELIDADGHILEPPEMWLEYIEPKYRDQAPRLADYQGRELWMVEDHPLIRGAADGGGRGLAGAAGKNLAEILEKDSGYRDNPPAAFDPHERIKTLDSERIRRAVLYPTMALFVNAGRVKDPALVTAACRAYNDWMADYCRPYPDRLYGAAAIPLHDIPAAIAELKRSVTTLGLRSAFIRPTPHQGERPFNDPVYDPFWSALQDLDVPLSLHPAVGEELPGASQRFHLYGEDPATRTPGMGVSFSQGLGNPIDMIVSLGWFIFGGVLERFPRLKVIILESGGGWIQPILERMDHHAHVFTFEVKHLSLLPTEYFRRQMWISFDPDEMLLKATAELVGSDRIVWASDFPHPDAKWPGCGNEVRENLEALPLEDQRLIAGQNAVDLYRL